MYCKKCNLEITDSDDVVCPLCNTPLENDDQDAQQELSDKLYEDQELRELISSIAETVKKSQEKEHKTSDVTEENSFDLEKALSDEEKPLSLEDFSAAAQRNEYEKKKASLESDLPTYDQSTGVAEQTQGKISIKKIFAVLVVVLAVAGSFVAAYLLSLKEPQLAKQTMPISETAPSPQNQPTVQTESNVQTAQPKKITEQIQEKTASPVQTVKPATPEIKKEQIPDQKPDEPPSQKASEPARIATTATAVFYTVNVGSFKLKSSIDGVMKSLSKKGYAPAVETVTLNDKNTWYRVTVGQFKTREEAGRFAKELKEKEKIETMVVKRK
jgi:cell division septation protein DedD